MILAFVALIACAAAANLSNAQKKIARQNMRLFEEAKAARPRCENMDKERCFRKEEQMCTWNEATQTCGYYMVGISITEEMSGCLMAIVGSAMMGKGPCGMHKEQLAREMCAAQTCRGMLTNPQYCGTSTERADCMAVWTQKCAGGSIMALQNMLPVLNSPAMRVWEDPQMVISVLKAGGLKPEQVAAFGAALKCLTEDDFEALSQATCGKFKEPECKQGARAQNGYMDFCEWSNGECRAKGLDCCKAYMDATF